MSHRINNVVGFLGRGGGGAVYNVVLHFGEPAACKVVPRADDGRPLKEQRAVREYSMLKWGSEEKIPNILAAMVYLHFSVWFCVRP